jgi:aryl carrier-like protein
MVPSTFVELSALPLTANGKVDRQALPAPVPVAVIATQPPINDTERVVAGIWADVLGVPQVGRHTSFFDLGGQSLQLLQVHGRLRERFGANLTVVDLFKHPTVSSLAQRLTATHDQFQASDAGRSRAATRRALLEVQRGRRG